MTDPKPEKSTSTEEAKEKFDTALLELLAKMHTLLIGIKDSNEKVSTGIETIKQSEQTLVQATTLIMEETKKSGQDVKFMKNAMEQAAKEEESKGSAPMFPGEEEESEELAALQELMQAKKRPSPMFKESAYGPKTPSKTVIPK